jgi:hypothetical protein
MGLGVSFAGTWLVTAGTEMTGGGDIGSEVGVGMGEIGLDIDAGIDDSAAGGDGNGAFDILLVHEVD